MTKLRMILCAVAGLLLIVLGWRYFGGTSPAALAEAALTAEESVDRQRAAVRLIAIDSSPARMRELLQESNDPAVRAIFVQAIGDADDLQLVELLLETLEDDNPTVRSSAAGALGRLMRCPTQFPFDGTAEQRQASLAQIRKRWETLQQYDLVDDLADAASLAYFFDQSTGQVFAAPSSMPDAFELPSGPYQGMPAAVRAEVFSEGDCGDPRQQIIGWLTVHDEILKQHGVALPSQVEEGESTAIKRPSDAKWVYANSAAGRAIMDKIFNRNGATKQRCRPGK